jgi:hypothetical protein
MTTATKKRIPKGGVEVIPHKAWNTKKYYTFAGYLARTYRHVPKRVRFKSMMVNDANQHLCGGWTFFGYGNESDETERRLIAGQKPLGTMSDWSKARADERAKRLRAAGLVAKVSRSGHIKGLWNVEACHDIRVRDIGDLGALIGDYTSSVPAFTPEFNAEFLKYGSRKLSSFLGGKWDIKDCPLWLTGLILGYPVENTISLYFE